MTPRLLTQRLSALDCGARVVASAAAALGRPVALAALQSRLPAGGALPVWVVDEAQAAGLAGAVTWGPAAAMTLDQWATALRAGPIVAVLIHAPRPRFGLLRALSSVPSWLAPLLSWSQGDAAHWVLVYGLDRDRVLVADSIRGYWSCPVNQFAARWLRASGSTPGMVPIISIRK